MLLNEEDQTQRCTPDLTSTLPETAQLAVTAQHSLAANSSHNMKGCLSEYTNYTIVVNQLEAARAAVAEFSSPLQDKERIQKNMLRCLHLAMMMRVVTQRPA